MTINNYFIHLVFGCNWLVTEGYEIWYCIKIESICNSISIFPSYDFHNYTSINIYHNKHRTSRRNWRPSFLICRFVRGGGAEGDIALPPMNSPHNCRRYSKGTIEVLSSCGRTSCIYKDNYFNVYCLSLIQSRIVWGDAHLHFRQSGKERNACVRLVER